MADAAGDREPSRSWVRRRSAVVVTVAVVVLVAGLARVDGARMTSAAWVRLAVFVALVAAAATFAVLAIRSPRPSDGADAGNREGLGIDGPEYRRVRRALRDGSPLHAGDRERALARARARLARHGGSRANPASPGQRWGNLFVLTYLPAIWLWTPPSFAAPVLDGWFWGSLAVLLVLLVGSRLRYAVRLPGAHRRETRARRRVAALENVPTASETPHPRREDPAPTEIT